MAAVSLLVLIVLSQFVLLHFAGAEEENSYHHRRNCPPFPCGKLGEIGFPYTPRDRPECGLFVVGGCEGNIQKVQLKQGERWYQVDSISQAGTVTIYDEVLAKQLETKDCESLKNLSLSFPNLPYVTFQILSNLTLCKCNSPLNTSKMQEFSYAKCKNSTIYYSQPQGMPKPPGEDQYDRLSSLCNCPIIELPFTHLPPDKKHNSHLFRMLTAKVSVGVTVSRKCRKCHYRGGQCLVKKQRFHCSKENKNLGLKLGLGIGCPVTLIILLLSIYVFRYRYKHKYASSNFLRRNGLSSPSSKSDLERSNTIGFGLLIFTYSELVEATNNFDDEKELGDGGFGTVYYGKLRDGREVAIKRLYQHNCRRLEQFINEVEILTRLRHKNLVSLYGCTSRRSRDLLLVYEFIPNGTVADHLHGDRAQSGLLTWPIRMSIAIETASALAYLHTSDIVHRDVKTNNILLDDNFSVKVADFGLSRLFPHDVTHISTAPQGTPGYVDPEYHQCYQLTGKSDVYSFGVVLIELISSMPAVDITRHRQEINLANLAINKIQKCAFDELIDPNLGYKSDEEVTRMTTSVAELAFRCLQQEKEMRPSMEEVLEELQRIQSEDYRLENVQEEEHTDTEVPGGVQPPPSPPNGDHIALLKNIRPPPSPISVTDKWASRSTTPDASG
ncbi:Protein kinase domain - like 10 [Theobroma cacao]|nr:Protein kinase domain - like 10 [Theobroma cacao]